MKGTFSREAANLDGLRVQSSTRAPTPAPEAEPAAEQSHSAMAMPRESANAVAINHAGMDGLGGASRKTPAQAVTRAPKNTFRERFRISDFIDTCAFSMSVKDLSEHCALCGDRRILWT